MAVTVRGDSKRELRPERLQAEDIQARLARLEQLLDKLASSQRDTHIHIENLHVEKATLEHMAVNLDQLDVKEVSGSLNIGNNFHTIKGALPEKGKSGAPQGSRSYGSGDTGTDGSAPRDRSPHIASPAPERTNSHAPSTRSGQVGSGLRSTSSGYSYRYPMTKDEVPEHGDR